MPRRACRMARASRARRLPARAGRRTARARFFAGWARLKISGSLVPFSRVVHGKAAEQGRLDMASLDATGQKQAFLAELNRIIPQKDGIALYLPEEQGVCK